MSNDIPRQFTKALALLGALLSGGRALAADYSVDFGVETSAGNDAGSLSCMFEETCGADLNSLGFRLTLLAFRRSSDRVAIRLYGRDLSCCYFAYAADSMTVDRRTTFSKVQFFKGTGAKGGLYVQNERAGTLYLRFNSR